MNSSWKTRNADLSIGEGSQESRSHGIKSVRRLQTVVPQQFSQALTVECGFLAAVLTGLLWPCSLGNVTVVILQKALARRATAFRPEPQAPTSKSSR